jgi:hypothetical protein
MKFKNSLRNNKNENTICQNIWDAPKAVLRVRVIDTELLL